MIQLNKLKTYLPEIIIIIISFYFFSNRFSAAVSSDDALSVLILKDFQLPEAVYCWGQDRGGSIVPLLGQLFYKIFNLSPLWSEGLSRYLILIVGYACFASFLRNRYAKILLAMLYFLPPIYFIGFTKYSWGLLYSLMGVIAWAMRQYDQSTKASVKSQYLLLIQLVSILAVWVMDQGFLLLFVLAGFTIHYSIQQYLNQKERKQLYPILFSILILIITALSILFLKSIAVTTNGYQYGLSFINNLSEVQQIIEKIYISTVEGILAFKVNNPFYSIYAFGLILGAILLIYRLFHLKGLKGKKRISQILLLSALLIFLSIIFSKWVLINYISRRYFSGLYFILGFLFIYTYEDTFNRKLAFTFSLLIMLVGFISTPYNYKYNAPKSLTPRYNQLKELKNFKSIGIIGDYWYAYGLSFVNPKEITASPHQYSDFRNLHYTKEIFQKDHIYIVKNLWLDSFPNVIQQFGHTLHKKSDSIIHISEVEMCEYKIEQ
jgi:hypothetical protein